ncbi:hypothetical protein F4604DRAFT_1879440 [Suillus subluteus]|nr:hypothetical protein F4604DRAFT_1879440 [Suillus subluteus]
MKVAVVGSGVSSLVTTWVLKEHSPHEVYLYEVEGRAGGHTNTIRYIHPGKSDGYAVDVDTVCRDSGIFECAGKSLATLFCQSSRLLDLDMWRLIYDVLRLDTCTRHLPMTTTIWSTPPEKCLMNFPHSHCLQVRFMSTHHLLQITGKPSWLTIEGGSRNYVDAVLSKHPKEKVHLSSPVTMICRTTQGEGRHAVLLKTHNQDAVKVYVRIIVACHSDACTTILKGGRDLRDDEEDILKRFEWNTDGAVFLHFHITSDRSCTSPVNAKSQECVVLLELPHILQLERKGGQKANINTHLPEDLHGPVLATLNPPTDSNVTKRAARFAYEHLILDNKVMTNIQGRGGVLFAGAWLGYGFHEDGFMSDLRPVVEHIDGVHFPFDVAGADREPCVPFLKVTDIHAIVGTALTLMFFIVQS